MRQAVLALMRNLFWSIVADEAMATEAAHLADEAERAGRYGDAEAMRVVSHTHGIRVLEARAYMAVLEAAFGPLPD